MDKSLASIYASLPKLDCKGLCAADCCKVARMIPIEGEHLIEKYGRIPLPTEDNFNCSELTADKRCGIYEDRPLICRLWGMTKSMRCPHGCVPEGGFMTEVRMRKLQLKAWRIKTRTGIQPDKILEAHLDKMMEGK